VADTLAEDASTLLLPPQPDAQSIQIPLQDILLGGYLLRPAHATTLAPAMVLLHGYGGDATDLLAPARLLAQIGYVALALSMRGWLGSGGTDDCGLNQVTDTVHAVAWLAQQPSVASDQIGILGISQGGQVALLAATQTADLKVVVAYKPVTDIPTWKRTTTEPSIPDYITNVCHNDQTGQRSPVAHVAQLQVPILLVHGDQDTRVPTEQSLHLAQLLRDAGRTVELRLLPGATHSFGGAGLQQAWVWTMDFLNHHLPIT
jgi:dipeptidyl aminopeptidase/acylaminoacyl peptidase